MSQQHPFPDRVLVPREAAALLGISEAELLAKAKQREIPGVCLGGLWRFSSARLCRYNRLSAAAA